MIVVMMSAAGVLLAVFAVVLLIDVLGVLGVGLVVAAACIAFCGAQSKRDRELSELKAEVQTLRGLGDEVAALR